MCSRYRGIKQSLDSFPIGFFLFLALAVFGLCIGVSLLIMARLSDDKETSVLRQVWQTFFGKPTPPHETHKTPDNLGKHDHE